MPNIRSFAADYSEARDKFLAAARLADATTHRFDNPAKGPTGGALSTDIAWVGPPDASKVVVAISSTHGVEGFCGSGVQVDWLASEGNRDLPPDTAALMVHFYREWQQGAAKSYAFRSAMLSVRDEHPHPFYWAPFVLVGNP